MKKGLAMMLTLALLLGLMAGAPAESAGKIPGTDFPMPDELVGTKAVSAEVTELTEDVMKQIVGGDFMVTVSYDSQKTAKQAREEYESKIALLYPEMKDSAGNLLKVADGGDKTSFNLVVKQAGETVTVAGEEMTGWFDFSAWAGALTEVSHSKEEHRVAAGTQDGKTGVSLWWIGYGEKTADFASAVSAELTSRYDESKGIYRNVEATELELGGAPACRVTCEMPDPFDETVTYLRAAYLTVGPTGEYVRANISALPDMQGPSFADLMKMFESTYTRTQPQ